MFTPKAHSLMFGAVIAVLAHGVVAQDFDLTLHAISSGGGSGANGEVELKFTIGQTIAGTSGGGKFVLAGGYWGAATRIALPGDCDRNGTVQLNDFACFANCFTGERSQPTVECAVYDLDSDGDVDVNDYETISALLGT